jgi:hypothetical protein
LEFDEAYLSAVPSLHDSSRVEDLDSYGSPLRHRPKTQRTQGSFEKIGVQQDG